MTVAVAAAEAEPSRRDFLFIATVAVGIVGTAAVVWPLIDQMSPDASTLAESTTDVDLTAIPLGGLITVKWQGKPVFVWHRTPSEIDQARAVPLNELIDPATDQSRVKRADWLVVIGICTHLGCVPSWNEGDYGGWLCHCHGSQYDSSGRVRHGPAPLNLYLPPYAFTSDTKLTIG